MTAGLMTESTDGIHITGTITAVRAAVSYTHLTLPTTERV